MSISPELMADLKTALRIRTDVFDNFELRPLVEACKADLRLAGVNRLDESDPLIERAIVLYCKANFGYSEDSEKYRQAYDMQKCALSLAGEYRCDSVKQ